ncbi:hypothetical protein ACFOG5_23055 [Pedobacter fastidiosus]
MLELFILNVKIIWKAITVAFGFGSVPLTAVAPMNPDNYRDGGCR